MFSNHRRERRQTALLFIELRLSVLQDRQFRRMNTFSLYVATVLFDLYKALYFPALPVGSADISIHFRIVRALHFLHVPLKLFAYAGECRQMACEDPLGERSGPGGEVIREGAAFLDSIKYLIERTAGARQCL